MWLRQIYLIMLLLRESQSFDIRLSAYDVEAASATLLWETLQETKSRPLLNLSSGEASPKDDREVSIDTSEWDQGQRWRVTEKGLKEIGISTESLLDKCPQLLRLDPTMVLESAEWLIQEFSVGYIQTEPRFLSFPQHAISYGLEFMSLMMMMPAKSAVMAAPQLLHAGIEGGLQERAVENALGAAGDATNNANQKIAGDLKGSLDVLFKTKKL
jgi:hypothetical protein